MTCPNGPWNSLSTTKCSDKNTTKKILRDAFEEDYKKLDLGWVLTRLKMGMPSAISNVDGQVLKEVNQAISDEEIYRHPLGDTLGFKDEPSSLRSV